jgi:hypothetical protein
MELDRKNDVKDVKINVEEPLMAGKQYITLLVDEDLNSQQLKDLSTYFNGVFIYNTNDHGEKYIDDIKTGEVVVINISSTSSCCQSGEGGLHFYAINQRFILEKSLVIYLRTVGAIKKSHLGKLGITYRIDKLPLEPTSKVDYLRRLLYHKPPQYRSWGTRVWQWLKKRL